jgi:hypothetical protein
LKPTKIELSSGGPDGFEVRELRNLLNLARAQGYNALSAWADLVMQWADAVDTELRRLRPRSGHPHIDGDAFVSAEGRRYCLKHLGFELDNKGRCIRCGEIQEWLSRPINY